MTAFADTPLAESIMVRHFRTVTPDMPLADVVSLLLAHEIASAPVVEGNDPHSTLIGFISEADCLEYLSNEMFHGSPYEPQTVRTMMKRHPICVSPDADLFALASIFVSHGLRQIPVIDESHQLLGLLHRRDVLRALDRYYQSCIRDRDLEKFPPDLKQVANMRFVMHSR